MNAIRRTALAVLVAGLLQSPVALATTAYPGDSLYQVKAALTDQDGKAVGFDAAAGNPTIVSMFYASCPHICPMLVASVRRLKDELPPAERARLRVVFVSFDPADTPAKMTEMLRKQGIDPQGWTLARTSADEARVVAAALGIRYTRLADGSFAHSTILTLVDGAGRPLAKTERFNDPEPGFKTALRAATAAR